MLLPRLNRVVDSRIYKLVAFPLCDHFEFGVGLPVTWQLEEVFDKDLVTRVTDG